jgi:superoxide dismutase
MCLQELMRQRDSIHAQLLTQINNDSAMLMVLADNMAECATNMQGQGYTAFITARETFLCEVARLREEYSRLVTPNLLYTST